MGVMQRISGIFKAKTNKILDKVEDPRESLDLSYQQLQEQLQKIRKAVADVATAKKRIELQASQVQAQADKYQTQAKAALDQGNEELAREALTRRAALIPQLDDLKKQYEQVAGQERTLTAQSKELQVRVDGFRTKKETMKATYTAAEAQTKVGEAVTGISDSMGSAGMTMQRAQDKIDEMQARAGAMDELVTSGALPDLTGSTDDIQAQLDQVAIASNVDAELAAMKAELAAPAPSPQLGAAEVVEEGDTSA
jgi:phage shock protein A